MVVIKLEAIAVAVVVKLGRTAGVEITAPAPVIVVELEAITGVEVAVAAFVVKIGATVEQNGTVS